MNKIRIVFVAVTLALATSLWAQGSITKEQAVEKALAAHPGKVEKAYQETKKGVEVWEVRIKGDDSATWKVYYQVNDGELFMEKKNDEVVTEKKA